MPPRQRKAKRPTPERLANAALYYLSRYAATEAGLRRVLTNKIKRYAMTDADFSADETLRAALLAEIEKIIEKHRKLGVLNDAAYAEMKVASLSRSGKSTRRITQTLSQKGVRADLIDRALMEEGEDLRARDVRAAELLARRRRLGPYRASSTDDPRRPQRDVAALARAGFSFDVIKQVLGAIPDEDGLDI